MTLGAIFIGRGSLIPEERRPSSMFAISEREIANRRKKHHKKGKK